MKIEHYSPSPELLKNRVILITGAGDGLGRAAAKTFSQHGATVILLGRTPHKLEQVYDEIEALGAPQAAIYPLNLEGATPEDYHTLADTLEQEFGQLNGILHSAAWLGALTPLENYDAETWFKVMQTNLNGPVMLTQACLPLMHRSETPSILFTLDDKNRAYWGAYGVSKMALSGLVKTWADELENDAPSGNRRRIRVNGINPGPTRTNLRTKAYPGELPSGIPSPEEKMNDYLYLIGNDSQQISGEIIRL